MLHGPLAHPGARSVRVFTPDGEAAMNKLTLNLDELRVDSFSTERTEAYRGTVAANRATNGTNTCFCTTYCTSVEIGCFCTEQC
jgi:hypothetical protein